MNEADIMNQCMCGCSHKIDSGMCRNVNTLINVMLCKIVVVCPWDHSGYWVVKWIAKTERCAVMNCSV